MPNLPLLAVVDQCPDNDCNAAIGEKHDRDCCIAICLSTGQQRTIHMIRPPDDADHECGQQVWTGYMPGAIEAAIDGLFVRLDVPGDLTSGWVPCEPGTPGSVPDLSRVVYHGVWNRDSQRWDLPEAVTGAR